MQAIDIAVTQIPSKFMVHHRNVRLTPKALGAKAATFEADKAKRRTFIMVWWLCCSQILGCDFMYVGR
jgi:hypothetical protein